LFGTPNQGFSSIKAPAKPLPQAAAKPAAGVAAWAEAATTLQMK